MSSLMSPRVLLIYLLATGFTACGDESPPQLTVNPNGQSGAPTLSGNAAVDRILGDSLFLLPATATAELQTRALVSYIGAAFELGNPSGIDLGTLLSEKRISPYAALVLAYHAAGALAWERRVLVLDCAPGTVWYLEVNTGDGRFLLDPYRRSVAALAGPFEPALPYADAFALVDWYKADGEWPPASYDSFLQSWRLSGDAALHAERYDGACLRAFYDAKKAVVFPISLDMAGRSNRIVGLADRSPWDIEALFADGHLDTRSDHAFWGGFESPLGPVTLAHQLRLRGLTRSRKYRYVMQEAGASTGYVVVLPFGVTVRNWISDGAGRWELPFTADESTATLEIGLGGSGSLALDWFAVTTDDEVPP